MQLQKAKRHQVKLRLNLSAPSGAGKTFSALRMASGLVNDWSKICVIDTENGSASLYSQLGEFNVIQLEPPFSPERYIQALKCAIDAGQEVIIIDSSSHEWSGQGGCLEINDILAAAKYKGNTWAAWSETTPRHDSFVNYVLHAPCHIITCTRSKMETVMGDDKKVKKIGMKDLQRDGWEYELTVSLTIDRDTHLAIASKDRTNLFEKSEPFLITEETGAKIKRWCEAGWVKQDTINEIPLSIGKPTLTDKQFEKALEKVAVNGLMKDGKTPVSDWLLLDVELTPDQDAQLQQLLNTK